MAAFEPGKSAQRQPLFDMTQIKARIFWQPARQCRWRLGHNRHSVPRISYSNLRCINHNRINRRLHSLPDR